MKITESNAKELFLKQYPSGNGYDYAGRKVNINKYGLNSSDGWNVDHVLPISKGGTDDKGNLQCINIKTNEIKGNHTTWHDAGKTWQVKRVKGNRKAHKVLEIKIGE